MIFLARARRAGVPTLFLLLALSGLCGCERLSFVIGNLPAIGAERDDALRYAPGARGLLDLYPAASGAGRPLVVFFYGGGFTRGERADYRFAGALFADLGYTTAVPDYRLHPEVGFPGFLDDAARAVVAAQRLAAGRGSDPHQVVLVGHSAGAWLAAMLAVEPRYLREAGGDPADIVGLIGLSGPYDLAPNTDVLRAIFDAHGSPADYRPLRRLTGRIAPTLLLHGEADDLVGIGHAERFAAALRAFGTDVDLRRYPERGHADTVAALTVARRSRLDAVPVIEAFLARIAPH
jgi:acetyl esterase/lipase